MHTTVALTISPPQRTLKYNIMDPNKCLYLDDKLFIEQVFKKLRIRQYLIYPEFDIKGRLHYHGVLTLNHNEIVYFYKSAKPKLTKLGFIDSKEIDNHKFKDKLKWLIYIRKNWGLTKEILSLQEPIYKNELLSRQPGKPKSQITLNISKQHTPTIFDYLIQQL